jgi:hypothetical protein
MNNDEKQNSIKDEVLEEIKEHKIKMHPKIYFTLKALALIALVVLLIVFAICMISFIVISSEESGARFLIHMGAKGFLSLAYSLPWVFILVVAIVIILIEKFIKKFNIAYRRPLIYSLLVVLIIVLCCGFFMHRSPIHRGLSCWMMSLSGNNKSLLFPDAYRGRILEIRDNEVKIRNFNGETIDAIIPPALFVPKREGIAPGDRIMFIGRDRNSIIDVSNFGELNCGCDEECY